MTRPNVAPSNLVIPDDLCVHSQRANFVAWCARLSDSFRPPTERFTVALIWERVTGSTLSRSDIETILKGQADAPSLLSRAQDHADNG